MGPINHTHQAEDDTYTQTWNFDDKLITSLSRTENVMSGMSASAHPQKYYSFLVSIL